MRILIDAMGGDNAPDSNVNGAIDAILAKEGFEILLLGDEEKISKIIKARGFSSPRLKIRHTSEVITGEDSPTKAIRSKKDASMVVAFNLLKQGEADVFVSAGNSGALMTGALFILGRIKGIDRPSLPAIIPSKKGKVLLLDAGLNTVCKPINYKQFAIMGSIYMKELFDLEKPKVGLINVGSEDTKGNENIKQAFSLISSSEVNFVGNIEGKDIFEGNIDVIVTDGFTGNVVLKSLEGAMSFFSSMLKQAFTTNFVSKAAYLMSKKHFGIFKKTFDLDENGGAPVLGVEGLVIKSHGSSTARTIKYVILNRAYTLAHSNVLSKIREEFKNMEVDESENDN